MNYTGPKVKLSRKLGINLTVKAKKYSSRKPNPPGQHGAAKKRAKLSDYGRQLLEKQRLRLQYNVSEKQMGNTAENLVLLLETRLDAVVYRAGFARSIYAARQFVKHGHFLVNGRRLDVPSYQVKTSDVIQLREKSRNLEAFQESIRNSAPPAYLEVSKADFSAKLLYPPKREEIPVQCEVSLVVEYYSR